MRIESDELLKALDEVDKCFLDIQLMPIIVVSREAITFAKAVETARLKLGILRHNVELLAKIEKEEWERLDNQADEAYQRHLVALENESDATDDILADFLNARRQRISVDSSTDVRDQT